MAPLPHLTDRHHLEEAAKLYELANRHMYRAATTSNDDLREELELLLLPRTLPSLLRAVVETTCGDRPAPPALRRPPVEIVEGSRNTGRPRLVAGRLFGQQE